MGKPDTANQAWLKLINDLMVFGEESSPRGHKTKEVIGLSTKVDMSFPVVTFAQRRLGYRFMCAEAAWILSGDNRVDTITPYSRDILQFSDDGLFYFGAYGPKVRQQLPYVLGALLRDRDTRQAVMTIWRESPPGSRDVPCTVSVQWVIRNEAIHCVMTMRSSDAWLGAPYDWFNFTMLTVYLAVLYQRKTGTQLKLGLLHFTAGSSHLYERNFDGVTNVLNDPGTRFECPRLSTFSMGDEPEYIPQYLKLLADKQHEDVPKSFFLNAELGGLSSKGNDIGQPGRV
jgi:thymidylate synthase